jgi:organic radical activating enzyme
MTREKGFMPLDTVKRIINEIAEKCISSWVCLHIMGEPTLHPDFFEVIDYLNAKKINISLITNGSFPSQRMANSLRGKNIAYLQISINAFNARQHALRKTRNYTFDDYIDNVKNFLRIYLSFRNKTPVFLSYLFNNSDVFKESGFVSKKEDAANIIHFWMNYCNELALNKNNQEALDVCMNFVSKAAIYNSFKVLDKCTVMKKLDLTDPDPIYRIAPSLFIYFKPGHNWHSQLVNNHCMVKKSRKGTCKVIERDFGVFWNGDCTYCCGDFDNKMQLGNVYKNSIEEILRGDKATSIKEDNQKFVLSHDICQICRGSLWDIEANKRVDLTRKSILVAIKNTRAYYKRFGFKDTIRKILSRFL